MSVNETIYNNSVLMSPPCEALNLAGSDIIGALIGKFKLELKMEILSETSHGIYYEIANSSMPTNCKRLNRTYKSWHIGTSCD